MRSNGQRQRATKPRYNWLITLLVGLLGMALLTIVDWASIHFHFVKVWGVLQWPVSAVVALTLVYLRFRPFRRRRR